MNRFSTLLLILISWTLQFSAPAFAVPEVANGTTPATTPSVQPTPPVVCPIPPSTPEICPAQWPQYNISPSEVPADYKTWIITDKSGKSWDLKKWEEFFTKNGVPEHARKPILDSLGRQPKNGKDSPPSLSKTKQVDINLALNRYSSTHTPQGKVTANPIWTSNPTTKQITNIILDRLHNDPQLKEIFNGRDGIVGTAQNQKGEYIVSISGEISAEQAKVIEKIVGAEVEAQTKIKVRFALSENYEACDKRFVLGINKMDSNPRETPHTNCVEMKLAHYAEKNYNPDGSSKIVNAHLELVKKGSMPLNTRTTANNEVEVIPCTQCRMKRTIYENAGTQPTRYTVTCQPTSSGPVVVPKPVTPILDPIKQNKPAPTIGGNDKLPTAPISTPPKPNKGGEILKPTSPTVEPTKPNKPIGDTFPKPQYPNPGEYKPNKTPNPHIPKPPTHSTSPGTATPPGKTGIGSYPGRGRSGGNGQLWMFLGELCMNDINDHNESYPLAERNRTYWIDNKPLTELGAITRDENIILSIMGRTADFITTAPVIGRFCGGFFDGVTQIDDKIFGGAVGDLADVFLLDDLADGIKIANSVMGNGAEQLKRVNAARALCKEHDLELSNEYFKEFSKLSKEYERSVYFHYGGHDEENIDTAKLVLERGLKDILRRLVDAGYCVAQQCSSWATSLKNKLEDLYLVCSSPENTLQKDAELNAFLALQQEHFRIQNLNNGRHRCLPDSAHPKFDDFLGAIDNLFTHIRVDGDGGVALNESPLLAKKVKYFCNKEFRFKNKRVPTTDIPDTCAVAINTLKTQLRDIGNFQSQEYKYTSDCEGVYLAALNSIGNTMTRIRKECGSLPTGTEIVEENWDSIVTNPWFVANQTGGIDTKASAERACLKYEKGPMPREATETFSPPQEMNTVPFNDNDKDSTPTNFSDAEEYRAD